MIAMVLLGQCGMIGFSTWCIIVGLSPVVFAVHVACIAVNIFFGLVNVRNMSR